MALFDSPNDLQWQGQIGSFRRSSNETLIGKIVDERGDGNYLDNMFQKYTVELLGWGQKVYNCKVRIDKAGYNGTGEYQNFKVGDGVILQCKEGQLDEAFITGSYRLNGDFQKLEVEGQGQKFGEHYIGPRNKTAASSPPSLHPGRVTKVDGDVYIGGVNNARDTFEDPTELGDLASSLDKQPIPGVYKSITKEGVDVNYSYGGILQMTDGNFVVMSSGTRQNKCTKYLEQANRHNKIASYLQSLGAFKSSNYINAQDFLTGANLSDEEIALLDVTTNNENSNISTSLDTTISISEDTPLFNTFTGAPQNTATDPEIEGSEVHSVDTQGNTIDYELESEMPENFAVVASSTEYRLLKHKQLANIAKEQAEQCNSVGAAYQYSSLLLGNSSSTPTPSTSDTSPSQGIGNVDPNNYSSRNTGNAKPAFELLPAHPTNYSARSHKAKYLVMHHSVSTMDQMIKDFRSANYKASAHYAVGRDGRVVQFVKDNQIAWHVKSQNTGKIGIEIVATKPNHGMTSKQEDALIKLSRYILSIYNINIDNVRGHNTFMSTQCPTWVFPTQTQLQQWANTYLKI